MGELSSWPTAVAAIGPAMVGSVHWHCRGEHQLTVVVKARFAFRQNAPMVITGPPGWRDRDVHDREDPTRSLVDASDAVPYRPLADVWLTGHAHAPHARKVSVSVARLALFQDRQPLLDKTIRVVGARTSSAAAPQPFDKVPLVWERAYGGIGFDPNPVGVGADERPLLPSLVDPEVPERPVSFGPISRYWKIRRGGIDTAVRRALERPDAEIPASFDWTYFQAAPPDQRVPFLHGNEWLVLDGMHPTTPRVQTRLPKVRGLARLFALDRQDDKGDGIAMVADTLSIDADAQTCCVSWRGAVPLHSARHLESVLVAGGVDVDGRGVDWRTAHSRKVLRGVQPIAALDRSGVTIVSQPIAEEEDLGQTTIDPHRTSEPTLPSMQVDAPPASHRRVSVDSDPKEVWPMYPLATEGDEVTETKTTQMIPQPADTEVGEVLPEDGLNWDERSSWDEPMREPAPPEKHESAPPARITSLPPAPVDTNSYVEALRRAGASEGDIQAWLHALRDSSE